MMNSFQTRITVESAGRLVLRGLPFKPGEKVRVVVESERSIEERHLQEKKRAAELFQTIAGRVDKNDRFQSLTEAEIAEEIATYRRGEFLIPVTKRQTHVVARDGVAGAEENFSLRRLSSNYNPIQSATPLRISLSSV